jgi:hypothetical protein
LAEIFAVEKAKAKSFSSERGTMKVYPLYATTIK